MSVNIDNSPKVLKRLKSFWQKSRSVENVSSVCRSKSFQYHPTKREIPSSSNNACKTNYVIERSPREKLRSNPKSSIKQLKTTRRTKCQSSILDNHSTHVYTDVVELSPPRPYVGSSYQKLQETSDYLIPQENFAKYIDVSNRIYKVPSNVPRFDHPDANASPEVPLKQNIVHRKIPVGKCFSEPPRRLSYIKRSTENLEESPTGSQLKMNRLSIASDIQIQEKFNDSDSDSDQQDLSSDFPSTIEPPTLAYKNRLIQLISDNKSRSAHDISKLNYQEKSNCLLKCLSEKILSPDILERQQEISKAVPSMPVSKLCYSDSHAVSDKNVEVNFSNRIQRRQKSQKSRQSRHSSRDECYIEVNFPGREQRSFDDGERNEVTQRSYCHKTSFETKHAESYVKLILN